MWYYTEECYDYKLANMIQILGSAENIHINNDADADADTENIPINGDTNNVKDSTSSDEDQVSWNLIELNLGRFI